MREVVATAGNALTIVGILLTFGAVAYEHQGSRFEAWMPWLVRGWRWCRQSSAWLLTFRRRDAVIHATARGGRARSGSAALSWSPRSWSPIASDDDTTTRVEKLARNLESLRDHVDSTMTGLSTRNAKAERALGDRLTALQSAVNDAEVRHREASSKALPWEVGGLLLALVGALLTTVASV